MKLGELLKGIKILESNVDIDIEVEYIANDHRKIKQNSIFVAIKGTKRDGNEYINDALKSGAITVIAEANILVSKKAPYVLVENTRSALSKMWSNYYGNPAKNIKTVAITGTNGKTSTAYYLYNILRAASISCGLISTIECRINDEKIEINGGGTVIDIDSAMTTPDPEVIYYTYNKMKESGVKVAVIEASSHALEQNRLDGLEIEIGVFTNLSNEHLDYHKSIQNYFTAKEKLIKKSRFSVINIDDSFGKRLREKYSYKSYGCSTTQEAEFCAINSVCTIDGCSYDLRCKNACIKLRTQLLGEFTVYNTLLAASCAKILNISDEIIQKGIQSTLCIKGRMEKYKNKHIYIDYAHTPKAMEKVIKCMKGLAPEKRLIVLFGCGGDRDKSKRPIMGEISTSLADFSIITADNSRTENLIEILNDILKGVIENSDFVVIPKRKEAIKYAVKIMNDNDVLLLLGKGHEEYEINAEGKKYFSEKEVLNEVFMVDL